MNERPEEYAFVFKSIAMTGPDTILDVGTGMTAFPAIIKTCNINIKAIDNDMTLRGRNNHYPIIYDDIVSSKLKEKFDMVTCISVLEHIPSYDVAMKSMVDKIKNNGFLVLTFPYNEREYIANNYDLPNAGYKGKGTICHSFSRKQIDEWIKNNNLKIICQEYWRVFSGNYWTVGRRLRLPIMVNKEDIHQLTCILIKRN